MMEPEQRVEAIQARLEQAFNPSHLEVIDDSHQHVGHVGAQSGMGHYTVIISSAELVSLPVIQAHRRIYQVLDALMKTDIHALAIHIK